eukprot:m.126268 g.126268  ORF g.126268 m.126268 type:complete len:94 (+) comp11185_c0_seq2:39-320(+)
MRTHLCTHYHYVACMHVVSITTTRFDHAEGKNIEEILAAKGEFVNGQGIHWLDYVAKEDSPDARAWQETKLLEDRIRRQRDTSLDDSKTPKGG